VVKPHSQASPTSGVVPPVETRFQPGQSGNPGGFPKGFVPLSRAYAIVSEFQLSEIVQMATGKKPKRWGKRPLLIPYVTAARMWLAGTPPAAGEIADRTEGKVKQVTETTVRTPDAASFFAALHGAITGGK
jgi:hypothetical protein